MRACPWKLVTIVSKLVYNLLKGITTYLYRGYTPVTKYHGHPSGVKRISLDFNRLNPLEMKSTHLSRYSSGILED